MPNHKSRHCFDVSLNYAIICDYTVYVRRTPHACFLNFGGSGIYNKQCFFHHIFCYLTLFIIVYKDIVIIDYILKFNPSNGFECLAFTVSDIISNSIIVHNITSILVFKKYSSY